MDSLCGICIPGRRRCRCSDSVRFCRTRYNELHAGGFRSTHRDHCLTRCDYRCYLRGMYTAKSHGEPPNQALEPTIPGVTPAADAPVAPPGIVAHLKRSASETP